MEVTITILNDQNKIGEVVDIHMQSFSGFFLTFLGKGFLKQLYKGFLEEKNSNLIIASDDKGKILGFLAYSSNLSGFYKYLIKKHLISFGWYAMLGFFRNPKIFFRLIRAFTYSQEAKREEKYIELSSIGVLPIKENSGIGSKLINYLKELDFKEYQYIKLETDAKNNEKANNFYINNQFKLYKNYLTPEKREMNEYRFYLKEQKWKKY